MKGRVNTMNMNSGFNNAHGTKLSPAEIVREILDFMAGAPEREYKVIIGSDSKQNGQGPADFVTAIVIHRVGNGGRYFWRRIDAAKSYHTLRDRILEEVLLSLEVARELLSALRVEHAPNFGFEIHVDIGENGPTKTMLQELVGMIRAMNFNVKTKPESYAASKVADRHV